MTRMVDHKKVRTQVKMIRIPAMIGVVRPLEFPQSSCKGSKIRISEPFFGQRFVAQSTGMRFPNLLTFKST